MLSDVVTVQVAADGAGVGDYWYSKRECSKLEEEH